MRRFRIGSRLTDHFAFHPFRRMAALALTAGLISGPSIAGYSLLLESGQAGASTTQTVTNCSGSPQAAGSFLATVTEVNATGGGTINFQSGLDCTDANGNPIELFGGPFALINSPLSINGAGASVVINGGTSPLEVGEGGSLTLSNVTMEDSDVSVDNWSGSTVTLTDDTFNEDGGAAINNSGTANLYGDTISNSQAVYGAGIYNAIGGILSVEDSSISGNLATSTGGGVFNDGTATFTNDTLSGDSAGGAGGGIFNGNAGTLNLDNATLMDDSTQGYDFADGGGGAVENTGAATLVFDTLVNDSSGGGGVGGVSGDGPSPTDLTASILVDATCGGDFSNGGYNVVSDATCGFGESSSADTGLSSSLATNGSSGPQTLAIASTNAAFEEVPAADCAALASQNGALASDERGNPRPGFSGQNCDAGAYELQAPGPPTDVSAQVSGEQAIVSWNPPLTPGDAPLAGYEVLASSTPGAELSSRNPVCTVGAAQTNCNITGLTQGSTSYLVVLATTAAGNSTPSAEVKVLIPLKTTTRVSAPPSLAYGNEGATPLDVAVSTPIGTVPVGSVVLTTGSTPLCTIALSNGRGTCTLGNLLLPVGSSYPITATYEPSSPDFLQSTASASLSITKGTTKLSVAPAIHNGLTSYVLSASLSFGGSGAPVEGATVDFLVGGSTVCTAVTSGSGVASCADKNQIVIGIGPTYSAKYLGDAEETGSSGSAKL